MHDDGLGVMYVESWLTGFRATRPALYMCMLETMVHAGPKLAFKTFY
jgi:hypothetical protein